MMPPLITDQIRMKHARNTGGAVPLLRSRPSLETSELVESRRFDTRNQASWLTQRLRRVLNDAQQREHPTRRFRYSHICSTTITRLIGYDEPLSLR